MANKFLSFLFGSNKPIIRENTFLLWEPCSKSHGEILPGYAKYLLDLGYEVSVLTTAENIKGGLFERFNDEKLFINKLGKNQVRKYFKKNNLSDVKGLLVTTIGKLCDSVHYDDAYNSFNKDVDRKKIYFVEHEAKGSIDNGTWKEDLITLRKLNYKNANSVVINPHYFGEGVKVTDKNEDVTNFITIGALRAKRKNSGMLVEAAEKLHNKGITNFRITVVGKGKLKDLPKHLRKYFDIKGRLQYGKMYSEIEKADYLLTAYDSQNPAHQRYVTTGTSGNFQLVFGFLKPCVIDTGFAEINDFNGDNAVLYNGVEDYANALERAINLSQAEYKNMQNCLKQTADRIYEESLNNLRGLING